MSILSDRVAFARRARRHIGDDDPAGACADHHTNDGDDQLSARVFFSMLNSGCDRS
ncbi:hypothetical protein [Paenirhodobacter populi]|uniref:hypothetical protein n=1 Tax=Paenirhodobacter populi TaxID=2306993 RepID=UPI0019D4DAF7|nr:hypothetical protein [Sinirhodobacter populi]